MPGCGIAGLTTTLASGGGVGPPMIHSSVAADAGVTAARNSAAAAPVASLLKRPIVVSISGLLTLALRLAVSFTASNFQTCQRRGCFGGARDPEGTKAGLFRQNPRSKRD